MLLNYVAATDPLFSPSLQPRQALLRNGSDFTYIAFTYTPPATPIGLVLHLTCCLCLVSILYYFQEVGTYIHLPYVVDIPICDT